MTKEVHESHRAYNIISCHAYIQIKKLLNKPKIKEMPYHATAFPP